MQPAQFERRILLTLAGHTPAIITETLYALSQQAPHYLPTEIHVITTSSGKQKLKQELLGAGGAIRRLCDEYQISIPVCDESHIHVIARDNSELDDIQTEEHNEIAADFITAKVRELTQDDNTSLHVSIAGGRKTMTYYLGYAMSVFGRIQDRMSHVLVDDRYAVPGFYYPTREQQLIVTRHGGCFDAREVKVILADLPFIRLRDGLTDDLLNDPRKSYSDIIAIAQSQLNPVKIVVEIGSPPRLYCDNVHIPLEVAELAQYLWLLQSHLKDPHFHVDLHTTSQRKQCFEAFFAVYRRLSGESEHYIKAYSNGVDAFVRGFRERKSNIKKKLERVLDKPRAKPYLIQAESRPQGKVYILSPQLTPSRVVLPVRI